MKKVRFKVKSFVATLAIASVSLGLSAQESNKLSDEEFNKFSKAFTEVQNLNQEAQAKMGAAVQESGLDVQKFTEIQKSSQDPNAKIDEGDMKKFEKANASIQKIQGEVQQSMQSKITESGLTVERFQQISNIVQSDKELQQKLMAPN